MALMVMIPRAEGEFVSTLMIFHMVANQIAFVSLAARRLHY